MAPLITREEALELGEPSCARRHRGAGRARLAGPHRALRRLDRHVLARQRQVGRVRGGLRLLRAVALRRGRDAAARDDGARADPRARARGRGGGRAPVLHGHPGPGAVQARLREGARRRAAGRRAHQPQALRLDRPHARRRAPSAPGGRHPARAPQRRDGASPTTPRSRTTVRYEGRIRTIEAVKEAGLETCVGGILNLGETREQRVEMAFELAEIDPTSVPINLLNPRPGTKFGDRDYMDPWEAVKWVAIFRLILPDGALPALRRARGEPRRAAAARGQGRRQRRDDGQLPHHARQRARARTARCSRTSASTSPASPTTAPTRARTTAPAGWRARRPTSSRSSSTRPRPRSRCACGTRPRSSASPRSRCRRDRTAHPTRAGRRLERGRR